MATEASEKPVEVIPEATILFAGDSGDGMQLTGSQFTLAAAYARNDLATLPDFPAEIRAPAGTTYGVSGFQLRFGSVDIRTPGDDVDLLVAMNPAALKVNLNRVSREGSIIVNIDAFEKRNLDLAGYAENPLDAMDDMRVIPVKLTSLTREALKDTDLNQKEIDRSKNMFALGLALWLYSRPIEPAIEWISKKFAKKPDLLSANVHVLKKGYHYGETTEQFIVRYDLGPAQMRAGKYRAIRGAQALALGLVAATQKSGLPIFYGSYPITPASDILHELSKLKNYGIATFQAEDEIAAVGAALGASFGGSLGITATSGPGLALKSETIGLAVMTELPLVIIDMQRGGPSTGLPTKTEQSDLLQALYGRNGEAPLPVIAASTPGDCFDAAFEACQIAIKYMTPVILLADGYLGNGAEPWLIPDTSALPDISPTFAAARNGQAEEGDEFLPYVRAKDTLARPWAIPGTKGLEHRIGGLEKEDRTGNVSYDPLNHERMTRLRAQKVASIASTLPPCEVYGEPEGDILLVGWGSTRGAIEAAVATASADGISVSSLHLRYLNPLPADLGDVVARFKHLLVPEINDGQLIHVLRARYLRPFIGINKVQGMPFKASEIVTAIRDAVS